MLRYIFCLFTAEHTDLGLRLYENRWICAEAMLETEDGMVSTGSYPREKLKRTQTPHGFKLGDICQLHREAEKAGITNSVASCTLMIELGKQVHFSMGSEKNIKITTVDDVDIFKALLLAKRSEWLK